MEEIAILQNGLPVFAGESWHEHVEAWRRNADDLEERLWTLGAIASSLTNRYGDRAIPEFASEVAYSPRRIWELAATYKAWEQRDRAHDLSFKHHTIAARSEDPDRAMEKATFGDGRRPLSTRELAEVVKAEDEPGRVEEAGATRTCEACGGTGEVPVD